MKEFIQDRRDKGHDSDEDRTTDEGNQRPKGGKGVDDKDKDQDEKTGDKDRREDYGLNAALQRAVTLGQSIPLESSEEGMYPAAVDRVFSEWWQP